MNEGNAAIIQQMIDDLDVKIETARHQSLDLVARLLDMARVELLIRFHGIEEREFETFCDALQQGPDIKPRRRSITLGTLGPRRPRGVRTKPRRARRSAGPGL